MRSNDKVVCGVDVHKKFLVAALITADGDSIFGRFTNSQSGLLELLQWLLQYGCQLVAAESTGVYWYPLFLALEDHMEVIIANPRQIKAIPGRKTDRNDAQWIAELARNGLIKPSRIFRRDDRELRKLTRARHKLIQERTDHVNRVHQILEAVGIHLASVVSDIFGKAGQFILRSLLDGVAIEEIVERIPVARIKKKKEALLDALHTHLGPVDRVLLEQHLEIIQVIDAKVAEIDTEVIAGFVDRRDDLEILISIPGIGVTSAVTILAEIGNYRDFPSAEKLAAWCGIVPSVYQSADTLRTGTITKQGSRQLRWILVEVAHAAARTKHSALHRYFMRLKRRIGYLKAIVALAHKILRLLWHLLMNREFYEESHRPEKVKGDLLEDKNLHRRERSAIALLTRLNYVITKPRNDIEFKGVQGG
ncbi:IS110 family transposase [Methanoculleus sp. FWC-SCC1]|uniref:IS110 family transposase n=1 Tax=Methanoculleus frigidifontis TaxID=2584085 RepID=A0ABT8M6V6_9EURY|nr:IS110 family transposase [Methanoculleus sp. FWC-SCC1]MDN7023664.1 IS110 family transposase [Methanoculleus sp. FWC-SCC1]